MKVKDGFLLREIAGTNIIVPIGERVIDFKGLMAINELGRYIWEKLQIECTFDEILSAILDEYDIDVESAKADLEDFLARLNKNGALAR